MVMEVVHEDIGEDSMHCSNHPHKNSTPGGICAFCLQEKLGKLVSSSYPSSVFPSSSSSVSSSPSSRSAFNGGATTSAAVGGCAGSVSALHPQPRKSRLSPFVSKQNYKTKEKQSAMAMAMATATDGSDSTGAIFKRSKSIATPRRGNPSNNHNSRSNNMNRFLDESYDNYSPSRRGFWSFLYSSKHSTPKKDEGQLKDLSFNTPARSVASTAVGSSSIRTNREVDDYDDDEFVVVDENGIGMSPKVSRSRSVGCGSRSFSGDFFERISTGFGDCTLRRVESQREGGNASNKLKVQPMRRNVKNNGQDFMKSRVRCGGIFSSFMIASVEESSNIKSKSWVWAFASPMRAFGKPSSGKRGAMNNNKNENSSSSKNASPNLGAIPSLLAVSG